MPTVDEWREEQRRFRKGHHGVNAYTCPECRLNTVTIDVDSGVTPLLLGCRRSPGCQGLAVSAGYPDSPPPQPLLDHLNWEWYLPSAEEFDALSAAEQAHVVAGGLILRERTDAPGAYL